MRKGEGRIKSGLLLVLCVCSLTIGGCGLKEAPAQTEAGKTKAAQTETQTTQTETQTVQAETQKDGTKTGQTENESTEAGLTEKEAIAAALAHAGVQESDLTAQRIKKEWDDGKEVYDVEFYTDGKEYDYEISAADGSILQVDFEIEDEFKNSQDVVGEITEEEAKKIALERVPGAEQIHIEKDLDDGRAVYEGEVHYEKTEYEFEIDAVTGEILNWEEEHH